MNMYRCAAGLMRKCPVRKEHGCDGTYNGDDCECARDNQAYMPPTEREELAEYRALGTVEHLSRLLGIEIKRRTDK